jgi:hypothetical protein
LAGGHWFLLSFGPRPNSAFRLTHVVFFKPSNLLPRSDKVFHLTVSHQHLREVFMSVVPLKPSSAEASILATIGDIIRGSLLTNKLERIPLLLQSVAQQVARQGGRYYVKNFWNDRGPLLLGYVGVHVKIRMPLPNNKYILMEVQIHPKQIMDGTEDCAKEIAHRLYKMPGEASEEKVSQDVVSSSQLVYLTSMVKLVCTQEDLKRVANTRTLIQAVTKTKADKKNRLALETALLLNNGELGLGRWSDELQAIVPKDKEAVATAWMTTAAKINRTINLPIVNKDEGYSWTNTATSIDELYADAEQIAPFFERMCEEAADSQPGCSVNFGPENSHMIKDRKSLQDKMKRDIKLLPVQPEPPGLMGQPASSAPPNEAYLDLLLHLLENASVQSIPSLVAIFKSQLKELTSQEAQGLTPRQSATYRLAQKLLTGQTVRQVVVDSLHELHAEEQKNPTATPLTIVSPQRVLVVPTVAFGAAAWNKYFGDVGVEPPLPPNIEQILSSPCPFFPGKTVRETQLLTLIPKTVNGQPFTLNSLGRLVLRPKQGPATKYEAYWDEITKQYGDAPIPASYWVLFTKDVISGSRNKSYDAQKQLIADYSRKTGMLYEMPTLLEAATAIFTAHVQSGTLLYSNEPLTFTRCQERVTTHPDWSLVVGGFGPGGLDVHSTHYNCADYGVGGSRKFS